MLKVKDRDFVLPGQLLGSELFGDINCFVEAGNMYSAVEGMVRVEGKNVKVIPSTGVYMPKRDDVVIGVIADELSSKWLVDINSPYICFMSSDDRDRNNNHRRDRSRRDETEDISVGDIVTAKVSYVNEVHSCQLINPWKLEKGLIIDVDPKRIPRVVGKKKSMLSMLREKTGAKIIVGQNGKIWLREGDVDLAIKAIKTIEKYAQTQGLTDRIGALLEKEIKEKRKNTITE